MAHNAVLAVFFVLILASLPTTLLARPGHARALRDELSQLMEMADAVDSGGMGGAGLEGASSELAHAMATMRRELSALAEPADEGAVPATVRVAHGNGKLTLGAGENCVSWSRTEHPTESAPGHGVLYTEDSIVIENANLTIEGDSASIIIKGIDLWTLLNDALEENEAQDTRLTQQLVMIEELTQRLNDVNASVGAVATSNIGFQGNPGKSCLDLLNHGVKLSGVYYVTYYGRMPGGEAVFCNQEFKGGGWTLLSAQDDDNYFSDSTWTRANINSPHPLNQLYSNLGHVDDLRGPTKDWDAEYWYESSQVRDEVGQRWIRVRQSESILHNHGAAYSGDFEFIDSYGGTVDHSALTGFGRSNTEQCYVDGNVS